MSVFKAAYRTYSIFFLAVILRCLYHSLYAIGLIYTLSIGLLLGVVTLIAYLLVTVYWISRFVLLLLSAEFHIYRLKAINARICNRFIKMKLVGGPKKLRKQKLLRAFHLLNDFCRQFQEINTVLDESLSMFLVGIFTFLFVLPFFLMFVENEQSVRLFFSFLATIAYMFCFSFSICNDRLKRQVGTLGKSKSHLRIRNSSRTSIFFLFPSDSEKNKTLENNIHHIQPLFESPSTKLSFNNVLSMISEHQISLTCFGIPYDSNAMLEVRLCSKFVN